MMLSNVRSENSRRTAESTYANMKRPVEISERLAKSDPEMSIPPAVTAEI